MIGAFLVATGVLLILAAVAAARVPGGAMFARPGTAVFAGGAEAGGLFAFARRGGDPIRAFVVSPIHPATWYANGAIFLGVFIAVFAAAVIFTLVSFGLSLLVVGVGLIFIALAIEMSRLVARLERWRVFIGEAVPPPPHPYRPLSGRGVAGVLRAEFADESRWRDVLYVAVNLPLAIIEFFVVGFAWWAALSLITMPIWYDAVPDVVLPWYLEPVASHDPPVVLFRIIVGLALLPVAASLSQLVVALHRALVAGLLCTSESRELRREVDTLRQSRSAVLDVEASELQRIERDLHDGAQQRLVMLSMDLGMARERIDSDPAAAKQLILEGQEQAREALAEIRQLVRGIAPSILIDRGLVAAIESVAGRGSVPTALISRLGPRERFSPATERTAYFVVTEALANVAKHSGATRCEVRVGRDWSRLIVEVWDDGAGGARVEPGGGLGGLASRLAAVDGTFAVSSPGGGPTLVRAEIPLAGAGAPVPESRSAD